MRRISLLLVLLAGCAGPDADPVDVAERFHEVRRAGDDRGIHALLTDADRAALPLEAFPAALPPGLALDLLGWGDARLDSARLLSAGRDTAAVLLHVAGPARDTLRLVATHHPRRLLGLELDRVRWRVSMGLAEQALLDSLAAAMRTDGEITGAAAAERAKAYLQAAERYPALARPADVDAAGSMLRRAAVSEALRVELRVDQSLTGARFVGGRIENPTRTRIATLRLIVRDAAGDEERVELWDIPPGSTTPVWHLTRLKEGRVTHRLERVQVF